MTAVRPIALMLSALLTATGATGCAMTDSTPTTAAQWETAAGKDLNCPGHTEPKVRPGRPPLRYDDNNDGSEATVVDFVCGGKGIDLAHAADQVEVFRGPDRNTRLARLSVVIVEGAGAEIFLARGCIYVTANKVIVVGHMRPPGADFAVAPSVLVSQVSTWDRHGLTPGTFTPLPNRTGLPPGCV